MREREKAIWHRRLSGAGETAHRKRGKAPRLFYPGRSGSQSDFEKFFFFTSQLPKLSSGGKSRKIFFAGQPRIGDRYMLFRIYFHRRNPPVYQSNFSAVPTRATTFYNYLATRSTDGSSRCVSPVGRLSPTKSSSSPRAVSPHSSVSSIFLPNCHCLLVSKKEVIAFSRTHIPPNNRMSILTH